MKGITGFLTLLLLGTAQTANAQSDVYVQGHYRNNGTYVEPYHRTSPNDTTADNYGRGYNSGSTSNNSYGSHRSDYDSSPRIGTSGYETANPYGARAGYGGSSSMGTNGYGTTNPNGYRAGYGSYPR